MNPRESSSKRDLIAKRIKEARILSGYSQEQVSKLLNMQRPTIAEIEAGRRKVSAEEIIEFANVFKVSSSWLLNLENENNLSKIPDLKFAARELGKLAPDDMEKVIRIIKMFQ